MTELTKSSAKSHQLSSTSTSHNIQSAKVPGEYFFWACTAKASLFDVFRGIVCNSGADRTLFLGYQYHIWVRRVVCRDLLQHSHNQISGKGSVAKSNTLYIIYNLVQISLAFLSVSHLT